LAWLNLNTLPFHTFPESMRVHPDQRFFRNRPGYLAGHLIIELLNVNTARMRLRHQDNQNPDMHVSSWLIAVKSKTMW
jgi:hypothetical protein